MKLDGKITKQLAVVFKLLCCFTLATANCPQEMSKTTINENE